ncbi:MAG: hypothetical protein SPL47_02695, partial [Bacteroidales bacterium]|nr:hypothetical protein [Bacteroidales bacterium]
MMDREGYAVMWTVPEIVEHALTFAFDYIIVEDEVYRHRKCNVTVRHPMVRVVCLSVLHAAHAVGVAGVGTLEACRAAVVVYG